MGAESYGRGPAPANRYEALQLNLSPPSYTRRHAPTRAARVDYTRMPPSTSMQRPVTKSFSTMNCAALRYLVRRAGPLQRNGAQGFLENLRAHRGNDVRRDEPGRDGRRADVEPRELLGPHDGHRRDTGFRGGVVGLPRITMPREAGDVDDDTAFPTLIMRSAASRAHRNTPVRFTSMTACHCARLILSMIAPSFAFDHQRVADDAGVVHQDVEAPEIGDDGAHRASDVFFLRDACRVGARVDAVRGALLAGFFERLRVEIHLARCSHPAARSAGQSRGRCPRAAPVMTATLASSSTRTPVKSVWSLYTRKKAASRTPAA